MTERMTLGNSTLADERKMAQCEEPFAALVQRRSRFVFRVAYAALRNTHDAEDVAQEVFLKLYRTGAWRQMKEEGAYLARVAWRAALERRTKPSAEGLQSEPTSQAQTPEQAALQAHWSAVVHQLMDTLPEDLRMPLALSATEELTSAEIAAVLGIPEGTARTRLMRARDILKQKLASLTGERHGQ
jgi:RNA polymerase sigma-70 factor (ECF subfamily)